MQPAESVALIRQFIEACVRAEPDEFAAYFTEDAIWWNAPWSAVKGGLRFARPCAVELSE